MLKKFLWMMLLGLLSVLHPLAFAGQEDVYVETDQWHVSLAAGYGQKSNPLVGGDDLPLVLLPEVAYYGESFYFDNGDLGFTLNETDDYSFGVLTRFNIERAYFSFLHPSNILFGQSIASPTDSGEVCNTCGETPVSIPTIDDLAKRKFAIDAGFQLNIPIGDFAMIRAELMQDVSGVYKGENALIELLSQHQFGLLRLAATLGLQFKSADLVDYYYGINASDNVHQAFFYKGRNSIEPYFKISLTYPISPKWNFVALGRWSKLGSGMTNSPVVEENTASTLYAGVSYAF
jgi:outer membrane protein